MTPWKDTGNSRRKAVGEATDKEARGVCVNRQLIILTHDRPAHGSSILPSDAMFNLINHYKHETSYILEARLDIQAGA